MVYNNWLHWLPVSFKAKFEKVTGEEPFKS